MGVTERVASSPGSPHLWTGPRFLNAEFRLGVISLSTAPPTPHVTPKFPAGGKETAPPGDSTVLPRLDFASLSTLAPGTAAGSRAPADLGCICTPKPGCLYRLLGSHPSRSVSLCLDIRGKNWRTGVSWGHCTGSFGRCAGSGNVHRTRLPSHVWRMRAEPPASVSKLDEKAFSTMGVHPPRPGL